MIGQRDLINHIMSYSIDDFPKSLMIVGEKGCGKHTLVSEVIAPLLKLEVEDITQNISFDYLADISILSEIKIYLIDLDSITASKQNMILKFLEEPPVNAFVVILTSALSKVLPTIANRCQTFSFSRYSDEELISICGSDVVLGLSRSPGKLIQLKNTNFADVSNLCDKLLTMNKKASLSNLLSVSKKIDWTRKDNSLIDMDIFVDVLAETASRLFKNRSIGILEYKLTKDFIEEVRSEIQFDRLRYFEKYLVELKYGGNK